MAADLIFQLRPTANTSIAIAEAIERAKAAQAKAEQDVTTARQARDEALLDAAPKALAELERKLTEARSVATDTAERISAVLATLETRLIITRRSEALAGADNAKLDCEDAGQALADWWEKTEEMLAAILREGERLDTAWGNAQRVFETVAASVGRSYPDIEISRPKPIGSPAINWRDSVDTMMQPAREAAVPREPTPEDLEREERLRIGLADYAARNPHGSSLQGVTRAFPNVD